MDRTRLGTRLLGAALLVVLAHGMWRLGDKSVRYLQSPFSRDYGEGCVLAMVQLFHDHGTYFTDLHDYPFVHANYPPLFILLVWPFHAAFGPSLLAPRALSLLATLALLAALFVLARRVGGDAKTAAALTGVALCPWFFQTWAPMGRVDMLALWLSIAGLAAALRGAYAWAFPLFWLAFFTKQNALVAPAAVLLHVFLDGPASRPWRLAAAFTLPLLGLFGALVLVTGGEAYRHLVPYTAAAEYEWGRMAQSYLELVRVAWPLLAVIATALVRRPRVFTSGAGRLVFVYWLLNLIAFATIAKAGAAQNYFIEPWLATILVAAVALPSAPTPAWSSNARLAAALLAAVVASHTSRQGHRLPPAIRHPERAAEFRELWDTVRATSGPVLSDNLSVLVVNGKPALVEPFGMLLLAQKGMFDPARLVRDCEAGRFALVVNEHRLERIPGFGACLESRYEAWKDLATYRLFHPR